MKTPEKLLVAFGGLAGVCGVALSAASTHLAGGDSAGVAAQFLLFHAPFFLALPALIAQGATGEKAARLAGFLAAIGLALFSGDLARRGIAGTALFPMAAPTGGILLMLGWALAGASAFLRPKAR